MTKYSFVIPVYNCEQYLEECVESILAQTVPDYEILLIDDGSTDGSGALCGKLGDSDERIRVFHKENGGAASARNLGIEMASGQYLLFVDGDDTITPDCLETVEPALSDEECLPVFGICFDCWKDAEIVRADVRSVAYPGSHTVTELAEKLPAYFEDNVLSSACNKVFPAKLFRDESLRFPESMTLYEDFTFVLRCLPRFQRIFVIPRGLYHYRNLSENGHLNQRVADLDRLQNNLAPLNRTLCEFGAKTGQIETSASVLANLYMMLLEQHLLIKNPGIAALREELPVYIGEEGFQTALRSGARLDAGKQKILTQIERGEYRSIWLRFAGKRWKRKLRGAAKRLLGR